MAGEDNICVAPSTPDPPNMASSSSSIRWMPKGMPAGYIRPRRDGEPLQHYDDPAYSGGNLDRQR
jgi:hypothetical protein